MLTGNLGSLPAFDGRSNRINAVIEASKGSRIKLKYDETNKIFRAEKLLPIGLVFPFDFGFIPSTLGGDGDPLDALLLGESGLPWGTLVLGKVVGLLKCEQTEKSRKERNDRIIAVPLDAKSLEPMQPDTALDPKLKQAIAEFFIKYNELQDKRLRSSQWRDREARSLRSTARLSARSQGSNRNRRNDRHLIARNSNQKQCARFRS